MKTLHIITILLGTLLISCKNPKPIKIKFDDKTFQLPIKVSEAKNKIGLFYGYYYGFYSGNQTHPKIKTQLENFPIFMGTDNDPENSYKDNKIVGVTFYKDGESIEKYKCLLEKKFGEKFKIVYLKKITKNKHYNTYYFFRTKKGLFVALKEINRNPKENKRLTISFYNGISENEFEEYLNCVN